MKTGLVNYYDNIHQKAFYLTVEQQLTDSTGQALTACGGSTNLYSFHKKGFVAPRCCDT